MSNKFKFDSFDPNQFSPEGLEVYEGAAEGKGLIYDGLSYAYNTTSEKIVELVEYFQTPSE